SYDFVFDHCAKGQQLKCLTVTDEFTKEGLAIDVDGRIRSARVIEVAVAYAALANAIALHDKQWMARDTRETILRCSAVGSHSGVPPLWPFWSTRFCSAARAPNPATLHSVLRPSVAWSCLEP